MAENTKIEWADHTFNPWVGCTKVSPACDHCYAEAWAKRAGRGELWSNIAERSRTTDANWRLPVKWNAQAEREGRRFRVFCASLADVFDNAVPAEWRADLLWLIHQTPHLDWLLLTKRIGNAARMLHDARVTLDPMASWPEVLPNVWLGATVVNQEEANRDIPKLLAVPARVRFLSIEPMLGQIDLQRPCTARCPNNGCCFDHSSGHRVVVDSERGGTLAECICSRLNGLHWVICGGESGPHARPMHPDWARSLRDQCAAAGVPFLFKQWGEWSPLGPATTHDCAVDQDGRVVEPMHSDSFPSDASSADGWTRMYRVGKTAAGRLLDGVEHNGFPMTRNV